MEGGPACCVLESHNSFFRSPLSSIPDGIDWLSMCVVCLSSLKRMGQEFEVVLLSLLLCLELSGEYLACSNCLSS